VSREIKFRGERVDNGELVYGYYFTTPLTDESTGSKPEDGWYFLSGKPRHCISKNNCVYEVIPESVGQFTGKRDKNGKEIYEKRKVKATWITLDGSVESITGVVEYSEGWCVFVVHDYENKIVCELNGRGAFDSEFELLDGEAS
jgi:uncharacterized phage protein (TIGR01671 family)